MPFVQRSGGQTIHYRLTGDRGPWLVMLQGLALSGRFWFEVPQALAQTPYRVVAIDNRGTGFSSCPSRPWTMADMADDVVAVMDELGAERAIVAGISMGGMIAQHLALRHPERVAGLVLMGTTAGLPHGKLPTPATLGRLLSLPFRKEEQVIPTLARILLPAHDFDRAHQLLEPWPRALYEEAATTRAFFFQFGAVVGHSTGRRLKDIRCPTAVVAGEEDVLVVPGNSRFLAQRIPGARLHMLPDVGHDLLSLDPGVVGRAVESLLKH